MAGLTRHFPIIKGRVFEDIPRGARNDEFLRQPLSVKDKRKIKDTV
jgi:hypothetical protein